MAGTGAKLTLLVFAGLGFWTLWGFPYRNGLLHFLGELTEPGATIPGPTYAPMKQSFTGIARVDRQLTVLVGFFYMAIDGHRIDLSLSFLNLGSQVLAAWILITTESYRAGNRGSFALTAITLLGMGIAIVGYAAVTPIWFALQLWKSKTIQNPKDFNLQLDQPIKLALAPISTLVGFGLPTAVMTLPAPTYFSFETKQNWIAAQQFWPIWIYLTQKALETLVSFNDPMTAMRTEKQKKEETAKYMRRAYLVALSSSAGGHLLYVGLGLTAYLSPSLVSTKLQVQLQPENFFVPPNPFGEDKARTIQNGALWFLQWDLIIGVLATMIWGLTVRLSASRKQDSLGAWIRALVKYGIIAASVGPVGAAVIAIWRRDESALKVKAD